MHLSENALPHISQQESGTGEFGWSTEQQGWILGAFYYGYVLTQFPGGYLAEKYGGKWPFGLGVFLTAVLTLLTPVAARAGIGYLIGLRVMEGICEGGTQPAMMAMMAKWLPMHERSKLSTCINVGKSNTYFFLSLNDFHFTKILGMQFGTLIALALSGILAQNVNWESIFYLFGGIGCLWFVFWVVLISDTPANHPKISKVLNSENSCIGSSLRWGEYFRRKGFI